MSLPSCIRMPALIRMTTHHHGITKKANPVLSAPSVPAVMTARVVRAIVARVLSVNLAATVVHVLKSSPAATAVRVQNVNPVATAQSVATVAHIVKEIVVRAVEAAVVRKRKSAHPFRISRPSHRHPHRPCRKVRFQKPLRPSA